MPSWYQAEFCRRGIKNYNGSNWNTAGWNTGYCENITSPACCPIQSRFPVYNQNTAITVLIVTAVLICLSYFLVAKRQHRYIETCGGYGAIPECINMLDNERYRWVNIAVFTCMISTIWNMINEPQNILLPNHDDLQNINPVVHRIIVIAFYFVFYAPIVMGVARYDLYGLVMASLFAWMCFGAGIIRDYACIDYTTLYWVVPEEGSWLCLSVILTYYLVKFAFFATDEDESEMTSLPKRFNHRAQTFFRGWSQWDQSQEYRYVQDLLRGRKRVVPLKSGIFQKVCYDPTSYYRYHSRILSTVVCGLLGLYITLLVWTQWFFPLVEGIITFLSNNWTVLFTLNAVLDPNGNLVTERIITWVGTILAYIRLVPFEKKH